MNTSKVVQLKSRHEEDLAESQPHHDFNKIYLCKSCGSAALRHSIKTSTDDVLNLLIPLSVYQCYSCNHRNRFLKDTLRSKLTLIGLSILAAVFVVFVLNKIFEPKSRFTQVETPKIITPLEEPNSANVSEFDLSYRIPRYLDSNRLDGAQMVGSDIGATKTISKGEERLKEVTNRTTNQSKTVSAKIDLSSEADLSLLANTQLIGQEIMADINTSSSSEKKPLAATNTFYTVSFTGTAAVFGDLISQQDLKQPLFMAFEGEGTNYYYGTFDSQASATDAISTLPAVLISESKPVVTALQSLQSRLVLVSK